MYGPFTVDKFANNFNQKLKCINSKFYCPGTSHVNWLCRLILSIGSVIHHLKLCKAKGTLFVPVWPSSYFWPFYYSEAADSVFNSKIILDIDYSSKYIQNVWEILNSQIFIVAINRCIVSTNVFFHVDKQHESKLAICVLQLIFPSLFLTFILTMIHLKRFGNLEFSNISFISYEWNETSMLSS